MFSGGGHVAPVTAATAAATLRVEDLQVQFQTPRGVVRAVDGVTFDLAPGERLGLVGESGSGKSTIALALLRMIKPPGRIVGGRIVLGEDDLAAIPDDAMRRVRMARIALIPQGAMNSLNPVMRIKRQLLDTMRAHDADGTQRVPLERRRDGQTGRRTDGGAEERVGELLESVGLRREVGERYPHELSGGMKQRVCIAIAIALRPEVIIADEPTSALDVVVQRQIMQTLGAVQKRLGAAVLLIGHDMGLMAQFVDRVGVMYGGKLVETGPTGQLFGEPLHPYSQVLIASLPSFERETTFVKIPGQPHSPLSPPSGCVFHPRCPKVFDVCSNVVPALREARPGRPVACHLYDGAADGAPSGSRKTEESR
jgi:peptide/nickel transport system ATP-binding protein